MSKVAVIGSNSFSGSHLVNRLLTDRHEVLGMSRSFENKSIYLSYKNNKSGTFKFAKSDIRTTDHIMSLLDDFSPEYIVNFSAKSEVFLSNEIPVDYFETNTMAVVRLCDALRKRHYLKKYIHISTCEVYGNCRYPLKEFACVRPTTPYAASKAATDMYLISAAKHMGFPACIVRSTSVFGECQQLHKIVPRTIIKLLSDEKVEIHGLGDMVRTFVYIGDVIDGISRVLHNGRYGETYHFSSRWNKSILFTVKEICKRMDKKFAEFVVFADERSGQDYAYRLDFSKSCEELGWESKTSFYNGLDKTIRWIKDNWDTIKLEPKTYVEIH